MSSPLDSIEIRIHGAGWPFIVAGVVVTVLFGWIWPPLGWLAAVVTCWIAYFFRDPDRITPSRPGLVISPADGKVQMITRAAPPPELGMGDALMTRVSIFLNVFDVHVNRVPVDGTISALNYRPGKFLNAALDKASEDNERMSMRITMPDGRDIAAIQIAGLVARRIRCDVLVGQTVRAGQRYGLIRFGSRCDVYLPDGAAPLVVVGQRAVAGETVLADLTSSEPARLGEVR